MGKTGFQPVNYLILVDRLEACRTVFQSTTYETAPFVKPQLDSKLAQYDQTHLLKFWDELDPTQQQRLADQINAIDFDLVQSLIAQQSAESSSDDTASRAEVPPAITLDDFADSASYESAVALGREALAGGQLAMILVAGGQGSRLGFNHPKGMYQVGPVSNVSLYQIHFEKVMARAKQFGAPVPMYVMTSPPTHEETSMKCLSVPTDTAARWLVW